MDDGHRYRDQSLAARARLAAPSPPSREPGVHAAQVKDGLRAEPRGGRPARPPRADYSPLSLQSDSPRGDFDDRPTSA